jgi:hypothetical protein
MGLKSSELNYNIDKKKGSLKTPQPLFWDKRKKKILDYIVKKDVTVKDIALKLNMSIWKVTKYIRDPEFQRRYLEIVEANTQQLASENKRCIQDLMRDLRKEIRFKIKNIDPNTLIKEYRLLLQGLAVPSKENSSAPHFQQNIISPNLISEKAFKIMEKAVLKEQGYKTLEVSKEEIEEIKNEKKSESRI